MIKKFSTAIYCRCRWKKVKIKKWGVARWNRLRKLCLFVDDYRGPLIILAGFFETFYPLWWATCETPPSHSIVSAPNNGLIHHHLQKLKMSYEVLKIACCVLCDCITSINEYPRTSLNSCMSISIFFAVWGVKECTQGDSMTFCCSRALKDHD
jgi:hypothetical protein